MSDLTEIQASQSIKVAGANPSTGVENFYLDVDSNGYIGTRIYDASGTALTSQANGLQRALDVGINVAGVQIDPRSIRALTAADVVTANQGTSPWVVSGTITAAEDKNYGTVGANTLRVAAQIGNATGAADFNAGNSSAQTLRVVIASNQVAIPVTQSGAWTVSATQGTSPWVVSGTVSASNFPSTVDTNYGTVGASTLRTASQIGNATGTASFNAGTTNAQTLRVVLPTDQTAIPVSQSGTWATGRTWTLASGTDSVSVVQSTSPWITKDQADGPVTPGTVASFSQLAGGQYNSTPPTLTNGQQVALQLDSAGRLLVDANIIDTRDTNYGIVGANTLRSASQIGNATGAADFNAGNSSAQTLRVVIASNQVAIPVTQSTSPWVISGTIVASNFPTTVDTNYGTVGASTLRTASQIGNATGAAAFNAGLTTAQTLRVVLPTDQTAIPASQSGTWSTGRTWTLASGTDSVSVVQSTSPWVTKDQSDGPVSPGTAASFSQLIGAVYNTSLPTLTNGQQASLQVDSNGRLLVDANINFTSDTNYGTVGTNTLRVASQIGNATGAALFGAGTTTAQVLRVVLPTDQTAIPVTQSGTWTTGRTWTLASGTDSVSVVQSTSPWVTKDQSDGPVTPGTVASFSQLMGGQYNSSLPTLTTGQQAAIQVDSSGRLLVNVINTSFSVTQGTSPWVVSGTVAISNFPATVDTNYGTVGASTIRVASQIGNATGAAAFNAGLTTAQTLRVVLPTDQSAIPVSQSGAWTTGRTWTLASGTDSMSVVQTTSPWITKDQSDGPVAPGTVASFSQLIGGQYNTSLPTLTNGQQAALQVDSSGRLLIAGTISIPDDTNYGTVGTNTLRTASQIGNATGAADFNAGNSSAQTLRVVVASNQVAIPVTQSTSPWVISGTVAVSNFPSTVDTNYGTVGASTIRVASQIGNATGAANFNAGATGAQTLRVEANQGAPATVANSWPTKITDGTNTAAVKAASTAPVAADPALVVTLSPNSSPLNAATGSGTISALNGTVVAVGGSAVTWSLSGTWVGTLTTQAQSGDGQWWNVASLSNQTGLITQTTSQNGVMEMNGAGWIQVRIIATAWTSGTVTVTWNSTTGMHVIIPYSSDGRNFNTYTTLTDSSQNPLGITAASTAATAAQEALVIAFSPNSPLPTGGNVIGSVNQGTSPWIVKDQSDGPVTPGTVASFSSLIGGQYNSSLPTLTTGQQSAVQVDSNGRILVSGNFSTGVADKTTFTYGTTVFTNSGGVFQDASPTLTAGQEGIVRLTANRAFHINLRDSSGNELLGQKTMAASVPVVIASDQSAIPVSQSGTWTVQQGTPPWSVAGNVASAATDSGNPVKIGGVFNTTLPTFTNGQRGDIQIDNRGRILVSESNLPTTVDTNYGTVGASTIRTASQVGNATGAADFNAGATGAQTLRTVANQGAPNTNANAWFQRITDGTDNATVTTNGDLSTSDGLTNGGAHGNVALTTANTAIEAKVGASRLTNRKSLTVMAFDADMYWGFDNTVTTSNGMLIKKGQVVVFSIDPDSTFQVWLVCATASKNMRVTESP